MYGETPGGRFLASQFLTQNQTAAEVEQIVADEKLRHPTVGDLILREYGLLRARQFFEQEIREAAHLVFTDEDYRAAADIVREAGRREQSRILDGFAGLDDTTAAWHRRWNERYADRTRTADEKNAGAWLRGSEVREYKSPSHGVDGARYAQAVLTSPDGSREHAVVATNNADAVEVVVFGNPGSAQAWLANRAHGQTGPFLTTVTGPACRAVREEEVLAWMLRNLRDSSTSTLVGPQTWTTHLRAELYGAMRAQWNWREPPGPEKVRQVFADHLLYAPGWAADFIGWPDASHALAYLDRLAATPVTSAQAYMAAHALASADAAAAAVPAPRRALATEGRRSLEHQPLVRPGQERVPLLDPRVPMAIPSGPMPSR